MTNVVEFPHKFPEVRVAPPMVFVEPEWEYRHLTRSLRKEGFPDDAELNALGRDRWEVVAMMPHARTLHIYLKRLVR